MSRGFGLALTGRVVAVQVEHIAFGEQFAMGCSELVVESLWRHAADCGGCDAYPPVSPKQLDTSVQASGMAELMSHDSLSSISVMHVLAALGL